MILNKHKSFLVLIVVGLGLILLFGLACPRKDRDNPLDPGAENYVGGGGTVVTNKEIICNENFNGYSTDPMFLIEFPEISAIDINSTIENTLGIDGTRALHFTNGTAGPANDRLIRHKASSKLSGKLYIEFYIKNNSVTGYPLSTGFILAPIGGEPSYVEVGIYGDNSTGFCHFYTANGFSTNKTIQTVTLGSWYKIKVEIDTINKKLNAWYDGTQFANNYSFIMPTNSADEFGFKSFIALIAPTACNYIIVDNLTIYRWTITTNK